MMEAVFLKLLNMSIHASILVLVVILLRLIFRRAPKWTSGILWAMVAVRLVCPLDIESAASLLPRAETIPKDILISPTPHIDSGAPILDNVVNPILAQSFTPAVGDSVNPLQVVTFIATVVWIVGMAIMLGYMLFSYLRVRRKISEAVRMRDGIYTCDRIGSPFILGLIRPRIYLPSDLSEEDLPYVLAHETAHLRRRDHLWKPLGFLLLTVYWFNPLLWVAYTLLCRDIEYACDEKVLAEMGIEAKKPYSDALINCSMERKSIAACPLAFGEVGVGSRIKSVLHYKKPAFWVIAAAIVACIVTAVCFLTNPRESDLSATMREVYEAAPPIHVEVLFEGETYDDLYFVIDGVHYTVAGTPTVSNPEYVLEAESEDGMKQVVLRMNHDEASLCAELHMMPEVGVERVYICDIAEFERLLVWENSGMPVSLQGASDNKTAFIAYTHCGKEIALTDAYRQAAVTVVPPDELRDDILAEFYQTSVMEQGIGWLFSIARHSEDELLTAATNHGGFVYIAHDDTYWYGIMNPTDVQLDLSSEERMEEYRMLREEQEQIVRLFLEVNPELTAADNAAAYARAATLQGFAAPIEVVGTVNARKPVVDYATSLVDGLIREYNDYGASQEAITGTKFTITKAEITKLELIPTGTTGLNESVNLYRMECRLKPNRKEGELQKFILTSDMELEDGWFKITQPYFAMLCIWSGETETWHPLGVIFEETIRERFDTQEMLDKYGDVYTAAAMEMAVDYKETNIELFGHPLIWYVDKAWSEIETRVKASFDRDNYQIFMDEAEDPIEVLFIAPQDKGSFVKVVIQRQADGTYAVNKDATVVYDAATGEPQTELLTEASAAQFINQTLSTLALREDGKVTFTLPEVIPTGDDATDLYITLSAGFSEDGAYSSQRLLDYQRGWSGGEVYVGELDAPRHALTSLMLRASFMTETAPNALTQYASNYIELREPFVYTPELSMASTAAVSREGDRTQIDYTLRGGYRARVSTVLPDELTLAVNAVDVTSLPTISVMRGDSTIGTISLYGFATTDPAHLALIDTSENEAPLQVFTALDAVFHAGLVDYTVRAHSDTAASATAGYTWQDIGSTGSAATAPWYQADSVLAYDTAVMPYFVEMRLTDGALSEDALAAIAESTIITKN